MLVSCVQYSHWLSATFSMGLWLNLSKPTVISAITLESCCKRQVELTDVKIYLEVNHAANAGPEIPARKSARPHQLQRKPFVGNILVSVEPISEDSTWINEPELKQNAVFWHLILEVPLLLIYYKRAPSGPLCHF